MDGYEIWVININWHKLNLKIWWISVISYVKCFLNIPFYLDEVSKLK